LVRSGTGISDRFKFWYPLSRQQVEAVRRLSLLTLPVNRSFSCTDPVARGLALIGSKALNLQ
jgi:hypothetical protein